MITFNGISSDSKRVIVERIPNRHTPARRFKPQSVAGKNGDVLLVDKSFPNVEQEYEVYLSAEAVGLPSIARGAAEWLCAPVDYAELTDDYDTTVYREAYLASGYDIENALNKFGRCTISFSCKPQKYLLTGTSAVTVADGDTIANPTPFEARPLITVSGVGTLTINGYEIEILESVSNFLINCETQEAADNSKIYCLDFPVLTGGANTIEADSGITSISIVPRWWTL